MTTPSFIYNLPEDNSKLDADALQAAHQAVQDNYPSNVYRARQDQEGHARATCEQAREASPNLTNDFEAYITRYTEVYANAYQNEMKAMDARYDNMRPPA